ncbi:hypothetical protein PIB30_008793 [Stylosanthes scabra]|uniref:CSC1-like protein At1g69450 n=1 Tax=Stylosanthes scabra TaxID=79078 RepID=A0ABU6W5P8_9FABA|nr:hypothetical protein [Stylosanthes scabra]
MIVSALLTSVGINTALCVVFFASYSILRKQPSNYEVYIPRLLAEGTSKRIPRFNLERIVPFSNWLARAWTLSEDELLSSSGLDALVFMRMITFSLKIFTFAGIIGIFVILPVNCWGNQLQDFDVIDFANNSLDVFTISNVNTGSSWLWVHFFAIYILTGFICLLLHHEYKNIASKRISYFYSSNPRPHQFTILVHSIPVSKTHSISDSVESFFREFYPSTYVSHVVIRRTNKIRNLLVEAKNLYKKIIQLRKQNRQKNKQGDYFRLFGQDDNLIDQYGKKLGEIEQNVRLHQSEASLATEEARAAFVFFKSRYAAATAFHMQQSGLTNLKQLEVLFPFLTSILTIKFVTQIITGYLPSLILQLSLKLVPPIMGFLTSMQGYISHSDIESSACNKVIWFTVWNVFLATVFSGSFISLLSVILDPKHIPERLAVAVPAQASFFITYVVTSGWTSVSSELFRIIPLLGSLITRPFSSPEDEFEVPSLPFHRDVPRVLFFGLLGITYFFLAPLILPFLLIYLCLAYIIYRNQFINVYAPKYETAGKLWPIVHNTMIFSLILMHMIAVGIFALKKLSPASSWMLPLPALTLLFNEYCRKRFLPIFTAYSTESLIKKDRQDQKDPRMAEFYKKLVTAYKDPALLPFQYSSNTDGLFDPLLS